MVSSLSGRRRPRLRPPLPNGKPAPLMANDCNWSNNNLACTNTWAFLRVLKELTAIFKDAGEIKMKELAYWNPADSAEARRTAALALASQLDRMFIVGLRAKYESGYDRTKSVVAMADVFVQPVRTVCELSVAVDKAYQFSGEKL